MTISRFSIIASLCAALVAGCAAGAGTGTSRRSTSDAVASTEYYYGTMTTTSPDGKVPYGPPAMTLVRRDVAPGDDRIVETVVQNGVTRVTTLSRGDGATFSASADDGSFDGTVTFSGEEWSWESWTYGISLSDGSGRIEGSGRFDGKWLETEKYFVATNGERRARMSDRLVRIEREEYERRLAEMKAAPTQSDGRRR
jgi:hypothetical protein